MLVIVAAIAIASICTVNVNGQAAGVLWAEDANGMIRLGDSLDTNVRRVGANMLGTDDNFEVKGGTISAANIISTPTIIPIGPTRTYKTLSTAYAYLKTVACTDTCTLRFDAGSYLISSGFTFTAHATPGMVVIEGQPGSPSAVTLNITADQDLLVFSGPGTAGMTVRNLRLWNNAAPGSSNQPVGIMASYGSSISIENIVIVNMYSGVYSYFGSSITSIGTLQITGVSRCLSAGWNSALVAPNTQCSGNSPSALGMVATQISSVTAPGSTFTNIGTLLRCGDIGTAIALPVSGSWTTLKSASPAASTCILQ